MNPPTIASDTLVEAIARALCEQHIREVRQWDTDPRKLKRMLPEAVDYSWTDFVDRATTALTAITEAGYVVCPREPTEAMLEAGQLEAEGCTDDWTSSAACLSGHVWSAMLAMHTISHCNHGATNNGKAE